jgi:hypothetical protein
MVKNITGIVGVLAIIFLIYHVIVCVSRNQFTPQNIVVIVVMAIILIADLIVRLKFKDK